MEGVAIGDPVDGCMSVLTTRNGGASWNKVSCDVLPLSIEGEAAFAASDTNIAIVGNQTWVATGGLSSRILMSHDKGSQLVCCGYSHYSGKGNHRNIFN